MSQTTVIFVPFACACCGAVTKAALDSLDQQPPAYCANCADTGESGDDYERENDPFSGNGELRPLDFND